MSQATATRPDIPAILDEVKSRMAQVPPFFGGMQSNHKVLNGMWTAARDLYFEDGALPAKLKEIMFGYVALKKGSMFCAAAHTCFLAVRFDMTPAQIEEALLHPQSADIPDTWKLFISAARLHTMGETCSDYRMAAKVLEEASADPEAIKEMGAALGFYGCAMTYAEFARVSTEEMDLSALKRVLENSEALAKKFDELRTKHGNG